MHTINKDLARIFEEMGSIYEFLGDENKFRSVAYHNAARAIDDLSENIQYYIHEGKFDKVYGIGKSTEQKILEFLTTGKIQQYEELKAKIPSDFIDLLHVQGLGPKTLKKLHDELHISTREELLKGLKDGSILKLRGFQKKKINNLLESLERQKPTEERARLWDALDLSDSLIKKLKKIPEIIKIDIAGSVRRKKETIGDLDFLIAAKKKDRKKIIRHFIEMEDVAKVFAEGETKVSILLEHFNRQIDLRIVEEEEWGAAMQYFTGSKAHNIHLRKIAIDKGYKINEYGLFNIKSNRKIAGENEEGIYEKLGMKWMPPEMREDSGEIELAQSNKLPKLIELKNIKGDLHTHSKWSDGSSSLEEIGKFIQSKFSYEYLVITDHSKSQRIAGGMEEKDFFKQMEEIKKVNKKLGIDILKTGAEVDILPDGSLDLSDELLEQLDWVVASIHSQFKRDNTDRIIKACENKFVNAIGHPTGRLLGSREPYSLDMEKVIEAAIKNRTALEINSHPFRMDLNDQWARLAKEKGAMLVIDTDSHNVSNYAYMKLGVDIARRAWCKAENILNTRSWDKIMEYKNSKRKILK